MTPPSWQIVVTGTIFGGTSPLTVTSTSVGVWTDMAADSGGGARAAGFGCRQMGWSNLIASRVIKNKSLA